MNSNSNPKLYRDMQQPFASVEEAQAALTSFHDELGELRKKHHIQDLLCIIQSAYTAESGEESLVMTYSSFGDSMQCEKLAAYALGMIQSERQAQIGKLLKGVHAGKRKS